MEFKNIIYLCRPIQLTIKNFIMSVTFNNVSPIRGDWETAISNFQQDVTIRLKHKSGNEVKTPSMKLIYPERFSKNGIRLRIEGDTSRLFIYSDSLVNFFNYTDCESNRDEF